MPSPRAGGRDADAISPSALTMLLMGEHLQHRYHGHYYAKAQALRGKVRDAYTAAFGRCDVVALPTIPFPAMPMPPTQATVSAKSWTARCR